MLDQFLPDKFVIFHRIKHLLLCHDDNILCLRLRTGVTKRPFTEICRHTDVFTCTHSADIHQFMTFFINQMLSCHCSTLIVITFYTQSTFIHRSFQCDQGKIQSSELLSFEASATKHYAGHSAAFTHLDTLFFPFFFISGNKQHDTISLFRSFPFQSAQNFGEIRMFNLRQNHTDDIILLLRQGSGHLVRLIIQFFHYPIYLFPCLIADISSIIQNSGNSPYCQSRCLRHILECCHMCISFVALYCMITVFMISGDPAYSLCFIVQFYSITRKCSMSTNNYVVFSVPKMNF